MTASPVHGKKVRAFVAFGANLGDPVSAYHHALDAIGRLPGTSVVRRSSLYRTDPIGVRGQPDYINAVVELATDMPAEDLLEALLEIEITAGRTRQSHRAPRTLDLDLLLYADAVIDTPRLQVPHPRMHRRAFVLVPLAEIAPDTEIPGHGRVSALLPRVSDQLVTRL
jgi:2-amino-4-hydroxy-6-hydroxymethyldihydropteridine diphosphokinase